MVKDKEIEVAEKLRECVENKEQGRKELRDSKNISKKATGKRINKQ